jgi:hypothetical protein
MALTSTLLHRLQTTALLRTGFALVIGMVRNPIHPCPSLSILAGQMTGDEAIGSLPTSIFLLHRSLLVNTLATHSAMPPRTRSIFVFLCASAHLLRQFGSTATFSIILKKSYTLKLRAFIPDTSYQDLTLSIRAFLR